MSGEVIKIVDEINEEIANLFFDEKSRRLRFDEESGRLKFNEHYLFELTFTTNGYIDSVNFLDIEIWNSDDDYREWIGDADDYEPLKPYLVKQIKKYVNNMEVLKSLV